MKVMNENDLRVQRTRLLLQESLIALANSQPYHEITIRDITREAQVGYKTFFRHYENREALLQSLVDDVLGRVQSLLLPPSDERATQQNTMTVLTYIETHAELFMTLLNSPASDHLLSAAVAIGLEDGRQTFHCPRIPDELMAHHFASTMISLMRWWLESGMICSKEEMADYIQALLIIPMKQLST